MTTDPWSFPFSSANSPGKSEMTTGPWSSRVVVGAPVPRLVEFDVG